MVSNKLCVGIALLSLFMMTGCWDLKSIQDTNYVTAIGLDYKEGKYVVYFQMLDFSNVAKQESGKAGEPAAVWSGHAEGDSVIAALNELLFTSQQRVFWGHVSSLVFTEAAMKHGISPYIDALIRFREFRYNQWVYGTREPMDELFLTVPFFHLSPLASILHHPIDNYEQNSYIRPIRLNRLVTELYEPGVTVLLPSLAINKQAWVKEDKPDPKLEVDGVFGIRADRMQQWVERQQLAGLRWMERTTGRTTVIVKDRNEAVASVMIVECSTEVKPVPFGGHASFDILVKARARIVESLRAADQESLSRGTEDVIRSELERTFEQGEKSSIDLYRLENKLYRKAFAAWKRLTSAGEEPLQADLRSVEVEVQLEDSGMVKLDELGRNY